VWVPIGLADVLEKNPGDTKNKKPRHFCQGLCGVGRDRTGDTRIFSPLLYRLSYRTFAKASVRKAHFYFKFERLTGSPAKALAKAGSKNREKTI
jgi:hypothetical protein